MLTSFFCFAVQIENKEEKNPLGCKNVGYRFKLKVLNLLPEEVGEKQSLYFIYNKTPNNVTLYQMRKHDSTRSLYLNHTIKAKQWAVLSTSESILKYICTIPDQKSTYGKVVDCAHVIHVCEYARVKYGLNNKGNFWVVDSNSRNGAVQDVLHYGIIPR